MMEGQLKLHEREQDPENLSAQERERERESK